MREKQHTGQTARGRASGTKREKPRESKRNREFARMETRGKPRVSSFKSNFSKKGGTRPPSPREVNSRGSSPAVGRFAPSGLPSLFPRLIEMIPLRYVSFQKIGAGAPFGTRCRDAINRSLKLPAVGQDAPFRPLSGFPMVGNPD